MTAKLLDGKALAAQIQAEITKTVASFQQENHRAPGLAVVLVGDNAASELYVANKHKACKAVGIQAFSHKLPASISEMALHALINQLNNDDNVDGILIQLPLPEHIDDKALLETIHVDKDVDGFHPYNIGRLTQRRPRLRPCTPYGIMRLLEHYNIPIKGQNVCIVGASNIVGRPMALECLIAGASVTVTHRFTRDLEEHIRMADIVICAVGKTDIVDTAWLKPGCVVIDVGINRQANGVVRGDIDFTTASKIASWITPVPGGVGPMTIASLLENTLKAATHH